MMFRKKDTMVATSYSLYLLVVLVAIGGTTAMSPTLGAIEQQRDGLYANSRKRQPAFLSRFNSNFPGGEAGVPRGGGTVVVSPRRTSIADVLGVMLCVAIIPSVAVPAVCLGATIVLTVAFVNFFTGRGFVIVRR